MNPSLKAYIEQAHLKGHDDARIEHDLTSSGWDEKMVRSALAGESHELVVPPPPPPPASSGANLGYQPSSRPEPHAVVNTFSTRGLEYIIMFISLGVTAISLGSILHSVVNNLMGTQDSFSDTVSFATAALLVALPIFAVLFLRLKRAELADRAMRDDPSRKRAIQLTLIITFLVGIGNIIYFVYSLLNGSSADSYNAVGSQATNGYVGNIIHLVITLAIAGGIFAYYWVDLHRTDA